MGKRHGWKTVLPIARTFSTREAGGADETIAGQLRALEQAFGLQKAVPVPDFPKILKGKARDVLISPAEQKRLVPAITDDCYRDAVDFKFATGWRANEVRTLQWKYVWLDAGVIHLAEPYSKTGGTRDHPLTGIVADIIDRWETKRAPLCPFVFHRNEILSSPQAMGFSLWRHP